jgi:tetratricopeptide (TPR) repeat protein
MDMILHSDLENLQAYFTDAVYVREAFKTLVATPELSKRILIIHGVGGVGKSSLLRMFRLYCKSGDVPVALASGDEAKSAPAILRAWADDLKADGVKLSAFAQTLQHYRATQAKAESKAQESRQKMDEFTSKAAGTAAETAAGAAFSVVLGSVIPGIGTLVGVLGGKGVEALVDWLRGQGFAKPEIDLLLDPTAKLTNDFLSDLTQITQKRRLVVMLDTFEQLTALEDWARDLVQRFPPNALLVLAGRAMPNWSRAWSGWLSKAHVEELKPMSEEDMRTLAHRYYATIRGGKPDQKQVEAIIRFARGLPIVVTTAVQLWVEYGVEDFEAVKAEVVADLVDRLKEGVSAEMTPILEGAAAVRWFNKEILRAVTGQTDVSKAYDELRRFPFVRPRTEGLMLHDAVREIVDEYQRVHDPERHRELHERAAAYFEAHLANRTGEEAERLRLELLYQSVCTDEEKGVHLFQEAAEELTRSRLLNQARVLLNDVNLYPLEHENSRLWRAYYNARLAYHEGRITGVENVYQAIIDNKQSELKLRAYVLCDWGRLWTRHERMSQPGGTEKALGFLERSLKMLPKTDPKLTFVVSGLRELYMFKCEWTNAIELIEQQLHLSIENGDKYGIAYTLSYSKNLYGILGDWRKSYDAMSQGFEVLETLPDSPFLRARLLGFDSWIRVWTGRYSEGEQAAREIINRFEYDVDIHSGLLRDLGFILGMQAKYQEAFSCFAQASERFESLGSEYEWSTGMTKGFCGYILTRHGELEKAEEYLIQSLSTKQRFQDKLGILEIANWLGQLYEAKSKQRESGIVELATAETFYRQCLDLRWTRRCHFECSALAGLVRIKHAQSNCDAIPSLLAEAERLAMQYEYNDQLSSLRLTQGHVIWDGHVPEWGKGFEDALRYYQHALIYALRFNRLLLDEVLSGRAQGTPLQPIIPYCLGRGDEGQQMLIALHDWWKVGVNHSGMSRLDTISPIPENILLLEAEHIARERETGDGSPQKTLLEQIEIALSHPKAGVVA